MRCREFFKDKHGHSAVAVLIGLRDRPTLKLRQHPAFSVTCILLSSRSQTSPISQEAKYAAILDQTAGGRAAICQ